MKYCHLVQLLGFVVDWDPFLVLDIFLGPQDLSSLQFHCFNLVFSGMFLLWNADLPAIQLTSEACYDAFPGATDQQVKNIPFPPSRSL